MPLVVDDHGDVGVALPVAGLVHADRGQPVERRRHRRLQPIGDPAGDVAGRPPCHMKETADRLLVRDAHQPRALRLEIPGEPTSRLRRHDHTALGAVHARHVGYQLDPEAAEVLMPPTPPAAATVIAMPAPTAPGASEHARTRAHPDLEHGHGAQGRIDDARILDHHVFDVEKLFEYPVHRALFGYMFFLVDEHPTQKALFTYPRNSSATNHHPRKQQ